VERGVEPAREGEVAVEVEVEVEGKGAEQQTAGFRRCKRCKRCRRCKQPSGCRWATAGHCALC
jgi:hypothetical protein